MQKSKFFIIFLLVLLFSGCGHRLDERYWVRHHEVLDDILIQCGAMRADQAKQDRTCELANAVDQEYETSYQELEMDRAAFGRKILAAQMQLTKLGDQMALSEKTDRAKWQVLKQQYDDLRRKINVMVTFVAVSEGL